MRFSWKTEQWKEASEKMGTNLSDLLHSRSFKSFTSQINKRQRVWGKNSINYAKKEKMQLKIDMK